MYNLIKSDFDENTDDILNSINEILKEKKTKKHQENIENKEEE